MVLTHSQAKKFYDRFGSKQDSQAFYEDAALDDLIGHSAFEGATSVFEFGCGTGRLAERLLAKHLPSDAVYFGVDISSTMIKLARARIDPYSDRAKVQQTEGTVVFPLANQSADRVVSTYVLDLLSLADIDDALAEARRVLVPGGKLCLISLTMGHSMVSRVVSRLWSIAFRLHAPLVGGCRPIQLDAFIDRLGWRLEYRNVISQFGIASEVLVASMFA